MNKEQLDKIKESVDWYKQEANQILEGNRDNYDGADGARIIRELCGYLDTFMPKDI